MRRVVLLLLCGVASCASPPPPPSGPPIPPSGIEGRYRGTARLVRAEGRFCPRSGPRVYELQNGVVTLSYQAEGRHRVPITAPIQPDGTFDVSDGEGRLQGKIEDRMLEMTIASQYCEHRWTMHLIP